MVDKILENYSKAVESTLKLQQEMLRNLTMQWSPFGTQASELPLTGTSTSASRPGNAGPGKRDVGLGKRDAGGMAGAIAYGPEEVRRGRQRHAEEAPGDAR